MLPENGTRWSSRGRRCRARASSADAPRAFRSPRRGRPSGARGRSRGRRRRRAPSRSSSIRCEQGRRARERIRDHLEATCTLTRAASATSSSTLRRAASRWLSDPAASVRSPASPRCSHEIAERHVPGDGEGRLGFGNRRLAAGSRPPTRSRTSRPTAPGGALSNAGACTECSSSRVSDSHSASCCPRAARRDSRSARAWRTARPLRTRARRCGPGDRG